MAEKFGFDSGKVKVTGVDKFIANMKALNIDILAGGRDALWQAGAHLENKLKYRLSRPGTGKTYATGAKTKRYKYHRASAPGMPPAVMTGRLRASITHNVTGKVGPSLPNPGGDLKKEIRAYVGTNVSYGYSLERGTSKILPRPWFYITVQAQAPRVLRIIEKSLRNQIKAAGKRGSK